MTRDEFESAVVGAMCMLMLCIAVQHNSTMYEQYIEIKKLKAECEHNLPRNENCVIVAMPKSKD